MTHLVSMSNVPTIMMLKSDRSVFEKCFLLEIMPNGEPFSVACSIFTMNSQEKSVAFFGKQAALAVHCFLKANKSKLSRSFID